ELAKKIGHLIGAVPGFHDKGVASPAVIENYIRAWSGGLGVHVLNLADAALRKQGALPDPGKPAQTLADIPVIKAFVIRHPSAGLQNIQDFYDDYFSLKRSHDTIKYLAAKGDVEAMTREAALTPEAFVQLDDVRDALSNAQTSVRLIWDNPDTTPEEKRQLIDSIYFQMSAIADVGNEMLSEARKVLGK
ncbi:MAG: hypothetical protein ACREV9_08170, partial [Burkholderiales bacterium]